VRLSLEQTIHQGLDQDPQTLFAIVGRDRSQLAKLRAQLDRFSLKADLSLGESWMTSKTYSDQPLPGEDSYSGTHGTSNASMNLQLPLFTGFRLSAQVKKAEHKREAAQAQIRLTVRETALQLIKSYWGIRKAELQIAVSQKALAHYRDAVEAVRVRINAGLAPPVDLNRMETRQSREEVRLQQLQSAVEEGKTELAVALGLGGKALILTEKVTVPPLPPSDPRAIDRLLHQAKQQRGELRSARHLVLAEKEQMRIARSAFFPQLNAQMLLQYGNSLGGNLSGGGVFTPLDANPFANPSLSFVIGATVSLNLFDTFNAVTELRDARYALAQQQQEERRLGRLVEADVRTSQMRLVRLYHVREPLLHTAQLAADSLRIVEKRYKNGDTTILDFLDAQFELFEAEMELADSAAAISLGWSELWTATGRVPGQTMK
jgi:outer membrane protein TolC